MDELMLKARLLEKNMAYAQQQPQAQPTGQQSTGQDKDGDGLDDGSGLPIKRVTTITEDINNKTGKVAQREQKTKITNPTALYDAEQADNRASDGVATNVVNGVSMKSDEMIEFYMGQLEKGMLGRMKAGVSNFLSGADTQAENFMPDPNNPGQMIPDPSRQAVAPENIQPSVDSDISLDNSQSNAGNPVMDAEIVEPPGAGGAAPPGGGGGAGAGAKAQGTYKDPTGMAWQGKRSLLDPRFIGGFMATGGVGNLAATWNQARKRKQGMHNDPTTGGLSATTQDPNAAGPVNQQQAEAQQAASGSYMPTGGGVVDNLKNMGKNWLTGVTPKSLGGAGMPLTGNVRTNMLAGQQENLGVTAEQSNQYASDFRQGDQRQQRSAIRDDPRYAQGPPRPPTEHEMAIMNASDVIDSDFSAILKFKREMRERQSTEAIRIGSL
mgnify:CR=1 FL=1